MTRFIAHRGLSSVYYQNSEKAFRAAAHSPFFYGIETDLWYTSDKKWVCCHDNNPFENETISVSNITYEEAQKLPMNLGKVGSAQIEGNSYICTAETYLQLCKLGGKVPIIELKCIPKKDMLLGLIKMVDEIVGLDNAVFISFHFINIARLRAINPKIRSQVLSKYPVAGRAYIKRNYDVDLLFLFTSGALIRKAHKLKREVNVWTVNRLSAVRHFMLLGVDYITTDCDFSGKV